MKKGHSKLSKNEPGNTHKLLVFDRKRQLNW